MPVCDAKQTRCELESALRRQMLYPAELRARGGYRNPTIEFADGGRLRSRRQRVQSGIVPRLELPEEIP